MDETVRYVARDYGATLVVLEDDNPVMISLEKKSAWSMGRETASNTPDIPLHSSIVSRKHGSFQRYEGKWYYVDEPNTLNGTFYNGEKISHVPGSSNPKQLFSGDVLRIDNEDLSSPDSRGVWMLFTTDTNEGTWSYMQLPRSGEVVIGRDKNCDICIPLAHLSKRHACVSFENGRFILKDCNSAAGTWVNSERVLSEHVLREKDMISMCNCRMLFTGNGILYLQQNIEADGTVLAQPVISRSTQPAPAVHAVPAPAVQLPILLQADIKTRKVPNNSGRGMKELIRNIRLNVRQGSLIALLGPAGAGKSTVMNCLNGMEASGMEGTVLFNGEDLIKNFERLKCLIGSVPQESVFHKTLTPEEELHDAAVLRLPGDMTKEEIRGRVDNVIKKLKLEKVRKSQISKLSGGEKRRVNIGIELVADRLLWCMDEPDAGLDPQSKRELFVLLRDLAHNENKSILTIIHDVSEIDMFDQVIMLTKKDGVGRLAFSGTPAEGREYFGVEIKDAYAALERDPERYVQD